MMIGDDDVDAKLSGACHALDAGNAVVDGDDDVGVVCLSGCIHDGGRQTVAELETIGHDELSLTAHHGKTSDGDRAGCGAVAVVVGNNRDALVALNGVSQKRGGLLRTLQRGRRQKCGPVFEQIVGRLHAARRKRACDRAKNARVFKLLADDFVVGTQTKAGIHEAFSRKRIEAGFMSEPVRRAKSERADERRLGHDTVKPSPVPTMSAASHPFFLEAALSTSMRSQTSGMRASQICQSCLSQGS